MSIDEVGKAMAGGPRVTISHRTEDGDESHAVEVPQFGLGVFLMSAPGECTAAVLHALQTGYRHVDTAMAYENEAEVGEAIRQSGLSRDEIFVTTKLRRPHAVGEEEAERRCRESLANLGLDHVDLYLVHAPPKDPFHREPTWKGMENCLEQGLASAIGVSNYGAHHLDQMRSYARFMPSVNQIEVHPWLQRQGLRAACEALGVTPMAYSPLARGHKVGDERLVEMADRLGCTPAQIAIRWCMDAGCITIPKSSDPGRIEENLAALGVDLSGESAAFPAFEEHYVSGWDPTAEP